jgi:preprotein translocase YajC subunit
MPNLKKGDKITTIGPVAGTIVEMREKDVTVKIDESANTRVKFARWAIRGVGAPDDEQQKKE